jgi:hypothetical protein
LRRLVISLCGDGLVSTNANAFVAIAMTISPVGSSVEGSQSAFRRQ